MSKFHFTKENANSQLNNYINVMFEQRLRAKKNNEPLNDEKYVKETDEMLEEYFLIMEQYPPSNYLDRIGTLLMFGFVSSNSKNKMDEDYAFETERLQRDREGMVFPSENVHHGLSPVGRKRIAKTYDDNAECHTNKDWQNIYDFHTGDSDEVYKEVEYKMEQEHFFQFLEVSELEKQVGILYYLSNYKLNDIAKKLKVSYGTAYNIKESFLRKVEDYRLGKLS